MSKTKIECINLDLIRELDPEGRLNIGLCLQCGRCSSGCTMRKETDVLPHQLNRMAILGMKNEMLHSRHVWLCASCQTCVSRCPMKVNTPELIDKLRAMATEVPEELARIRTFHESLLGSVNQFGRVYEFGLMGIYKIKTRDFFSDLKKIPTMLRKGKLRLMPPRTSGRSAVSSIISRIRRSGK
jgi:heterodisulfide reductase subunit C